MLGNFSSTLGIELFELLLQSIVQGQTTIFYYNPLGLNCSWLWHQQRNLTYNPQFVWRTSLPYKRLRNEQNSDIFVLACLSTEYIETDLVGLSKSLTHLWEVKVFIEVIKDHASTEYSVATRILRFCLQEGMLNVVVYFQHSINIYSYLAYREFTLIKQRLSPGLQLYRSPLEVLRGLQLRVMPDLSEPNTFEYFDEQGQRQMSGFLWDFATNFASKFDANIIIKRPTWISSRSLIHLRDTMQELALNGSLDLGLLTTFIRTYRERDLYQFSYPVFCARWCTMLPMERPISIPDLIRRVLNSNAMVLIIVISIAWILAKPYWPRLKWLLPLPCLNPILSILSLFVFSAYIAQLCSTLIGRPQKASIDSYDDLLASGLHIFGMRSEFDGLDGNFRAKYAAAFTLTSNPKELYIRRNVFNTTWAYTITTIKWHIMKAQQRHFTHPVFQFSEKLCFNGYSPYSMVISDKCVFREQLKHYIMIIYQSGLLDHWMTHSFYDMVKAGYMQIKDYSTINHIRPLRLDDYRFAQWCCSLGLLMAFIVFVLELMRHWVNIFLDSL